MENNERGEKLVLKKWVRSAILVVLTSFALFSSFLIYMGFNPKKETTPYYSYNINRNINYKVYLKENEFYEEPYLEEGRQYTSQLIDYIDIDFGYEYNGSKKGEYIYSYDVKGSIVGEYENVDDEKSELWAKKYSFVDSQRKNSTGTRFNIDKNLKIDYSEYNKVVEDFKKKFKLAIDAYLNISLNIKYEAKVEDSSKPIKGSDTLEIIIPLSKSTINIKTKNNESTSKSLVLESKKYDSTSMYLGFLILSLTLIVFMSLINQIFVDNRSQYKKNIEKLIREYKEIIVETTSPINYDELEIYEINDFDDMVDVEEELKSPIILYEKVKNHECHFVIINDKYAYRYILKSGE